MEVEMSQYNNLSQDNKINVNDDLNTNSSSPSLIIFNTSNYDNKKLIKKKITKNTQFNKTDIISNYYNISNYNLRKNEKYLFNHGLKFIQFPSKKVH